MSGRAGSWNSGPPRTCSYWTSPAAGRLDPARPARSRPGDWLRKRTIAWSAPVVLEATVAKDQGERVGLSARPRRRWSWRAADAWKDIAVPVDGARSICPICPSDEAPAARRSRGRRRGHQHGVLPGRGQIDLGRADPRAAVSGAADEAIVQGRLPGPVPDVRREPEHDDLHMRDDVDRSPAWPGLKALLNENDDA